ncbi:hypothetical protein [Streptomyces mirabilis]|uniref:hypothetical protein n=1 Tax=Streptomyces mirabilis TaxID=68239 RepID=UPI003676F847
MDGCAGGGLIRSEPRVADPDPHIQFVDVPLREDSWRAVLVLSTRPGANAVAPHELAVGFPGVGVVAQLHPAAVHDDGGRG